MFERWYALDAGSHQIRIYDESKDCFVQFQSLIAYKNNEIVALSHDALEYVYHRSTSIKVKYPFSEGKIKGDIVPLIQYGLNLKKEKSIFSKPCLLICLPDKNETEQDKWLKALKNEGIRKIEFISIPQLMNEKIHFYIHAGHSYTLIGCNVNGKEILYKQIPFAGIQMDEAIVQTVLKKTSCIISKEDARILKEACSKSLNINKNANLTCFGMNKYNQYEKINITSMKIWPDLLAIEQQIVSWTKQMISSCNLDLQEKILEQGIYLSGGLANCFGLRAYLKHELHCPIICTQSPQYDIINKMKGWKK